MAGVSTSLSIQDKMTAKLNKITAAWQKMTRASTAANKAAESVNPGKNMAKATSVIDRARAKLDEFINKQRDAEDGAEQVKNAWGGVGGVIKSALAALSVKAITDKIKQAVDAYNENFTFEVQLAAVMKNAGNTRAEFDSVLGRAAALQGSTTFEDTALVAGAAELSTYLKDAKALEAMMGTLTNYAAGMGGVSADPAQMIEYATQLGKALDGTYDGLQKKGFVLTDAQKQIIDFGTDLERVAVITDVINQSWAGLAEAFAATPAGKIEKLKNTAGQLSETIGGRLSSSVMGLMDAVNNLLSSGTMSGFIDGIITGINLIIMGITWLVGGIRAVGEIVQQNWSIIAPILMVAATVLLPMMLLRLWAMVAPILAQAAAWAIANAPLIIMIVLIGLILREIMRLGVTFEDVLGFVGGLIGGLYATAYNTIASLWNYWASFAEFFANAFNHPIYSIKKLFVGLADSILDLIKSIATAIDAVFGGNLANGVQGLQDKMKSWLGEMPEGYKVIQKLEMKSIPDAVNKGYNIGVSAADNITDVLSGIGSNLLDPWSIPAGSAGLGGSELDSIGSVGEVGKIKEDVNIADEDLKFLRDVAEMRYVQNFVTLTPTVSVDAQISETVDIDDVVRKIEDIMEEELAVAAEGVYN